MSPTSPAGAPPASPVLRPVYPCGHPEHVCVRPRRASTSSVISLPVRRRESVSRRDRERGDREVSPTTQTPHAHAHAHAHAPLGTVVSGLSDCSVTERADEDVFADDNNDDDDEKKAGRQMSASAASTATATATAEYEKAKAAAIAPRVPRRSRLPWRARRADPESGAHTELEWNWSRWGAETVASPALVPALITQALATGLLDATTYADFQTFASNQTGNAILLTLSAVGTAKILLVLTAVSFGGFIGGAFTFGHIGHWVGVRRRLWLIFSTFVQTMFLVVAAILVSPHGPSATNLGGPHEWVVLFLFAAMSGAQVAMARQSSCQELPTAPMTSTFVDFVADHYLFAAWSDPRATPRNRRITYVIAMIGGSFVGAAMHRWSASWVVIAVAVGVKFVALLLLCVAAPEEE